MVEPADPPARDALEPASDAPGSPAGDAPVPPVPDAAEPDGAGAGPWALEDLYDPRTVALIDDAAPAARGRRTERRGRSGVAGMLLAGAMAGVADVLEPERQRPEIVDFRPDAPDPDTMPVQFVHVVGSPSASRLIIRPWLFTRRR